MAGILLRGLVMICGPGEQHFENSKVTDKWVKTNLAVVLRFEALAMAGILLRGLVMICGPGEDHPENSDVGHFVFGPQGPLGTNRPTALGPMPKA